MPLLKLFNVWDSFREVCFVRHIFALSECAFSIPYPVVLGFGATTKGVWIIFLFEDFILETWTETLSSFKNFSSKRL